MVILDTCALIELCLSSPQLAKKTIDQIEKGATLLSISFAEIACKLRFGKLSMSLSVEALFQQYQSIPNFSIVDTTVEDWLAAINLAWEHKDPADRLIVSYAQRFGLTIVTSDKKIKSFYKKVLW